MKRKKILVVACLTATAATGTFAFAARTSAAAGLFSILTTPQPQQQTAVMSAPPRKSAAPFTKLMTSATAAQPQVSAPEVPPQIVYHFFFKRIQLLEQKAQELDARGENGSAVRKLYQQTIGLTDEQNAFLLTTANDCMNEVRITDDTAAPIIEQLAAANQNRAFSPEAPPVASEQLTDLQNQREQIVLSYRGLLESNFGEETFLRLEKFVKEKISSNIQSNVNLQTAGVPTTSRTATDGSLAPGNLVQPGNAAPKENSR